LNDKVSPAAAIANAAISSRESNAPARER
jgi:hypothetical protein